LRRLRATTNRIKKTSQTDRVYKLQLNPDRAEVIDFAGDIYTQVMELAKSSEIISPNHGLKDGILQKIWLDYHNKVAKPSYRIPRK